MNDETGSTLRSLSVPRSQSLALRPSNTLVTRGLHEIAQFGNRARAKELVELGNECYGKGWDQAIAYYTEAIRLDQTFAVAYYGRGAIYLAEKDFDSAIVDFTEAIRLDSQFVIAYNQRGIAYFANGDFDRAIADFAEDLRLDPKDRVGREIRMRALLDMGEYDLYIEDLTEAIRLDACGSLSIPKLYCTRGTTYLNDKRDYDSAIADFTEAIRLEPDYENAYSYYNRGLAYQAKGQHAKAESDFAEAKRRGYKP